MLCVVLAGKAKSALQHVTRWVFLGIERPFVHDRVIPLYLGRLKLSICAQPGPNSIHVRS
jgi:hypothetical protein